MSTSSACHDPYREVELYLEKAQEEIGKAFEELLQHDGGFDSSNCSQCEPLLPPPPAFRSPVALPPRTISKLTSHPLDENSRATVTRVCYDGNVLDLAGNFKRRAPPHPLRKTVSSPPSGSFFSKVGANILVQNGDGLVIKDGNVVCSPITRRKIMQLRPCVSMPEGYNGVNTHETVTLTNNRFLIDQNDKKESLYCNLARKMTTTDSVNSDNAFPHLMSMEGGRRMRQRSFSEVSPPLLRTVSVDEQYHTFPRPPSGDVNLLSIWADNLVLEIDRSMSGDVYGSGASSSPSSASSLSPTKQDNEDAEIGNSFHSSKGNNHQVRKTRSSKDQVQEEKYRKLTLPFRGGCKGSKTSCDLQVMCPSPDSGIDQFCCETPEACEGVVSSTNSPQAGKTKDSVQPSCNLSQRDETDAQANESIAPPPPEFEDDHNSGSNVAVDVESNLKGEQSSKSSSGQNENKSSTESKSASKRLLMVANSVLLMYESTTLNEFDNKEIHRLARVIPKASIELEDCATLASTTCIVTESDESNQSLVVSSDRDNYKAQDRKPNFSVESEMSSSSNKPPRGSGSGGETEEDDDVFENENSTEDNSSCSVNNTLPANVFRVSNVSKNIGRVKALERWSNSLPRDAGRNTPLEMEPVQCPQRSSSSSAVSNISQVSMDELAAFMRKVKSSTYHPPPRADVCVGAKEVDTGMEGGEDEDQNRDAVTQTTPVLSRSSSFTWVTECDCSDWDSSNLRSGSDDSLLIFSCSNCTSEKKTNLSQSSSSSPVVSSEEEDLLHHSERSSLSLSACSEGSEESRRSDGPQKDTAAPANATVTTDARTVSNAVSSRKDKIVKSSDEKKASETLSFASVSEGATVELRGQSASFPSTLRARSKKPGAHPPPIEPHVLISELNVKSASAPMLRPHCHLAAKKEGSSSTQSSPPTAARAAGGPLQEKTNVPPRAHSAKELNELQAIEACSWLRAAGFPQYAQMYEDNLFPIDICTVQKDHAFLHPDSIQSLFRRLNTLNRCARMKFIDNIPRKSLHVDESDDEEQCALSENWQFQRTSRRWSRVPSPPEGLTESGTCGHDPPSPKPYLYPPSSPMRKFLSPEEAYCSSHDSVFIDEQQSSPDSIRRSTGGTDERYHVTPYHRGGGGGSPGSSSGSGGTPSCGSEDVLEKALDVHQRNLRRSGSDRIKEGAKALLRRMESLKGKRKKKNQEAGNVDSMHDITLSMAANSGTDGSSSSSMTPSPQLSRSLRVRGDSPQDISDCSQGSTPLVKHRKKGWGVLCKGDTDSNAHSDSECPVLLVSERWKDANCNDTKLIEHYVTSQASVTITSSKADRDWHTNSHNDKTSAQDHNSCYTNLLRQNQQETKKTNWLHPNFDPSQDEEEEGGEKRGSYYDNLPAPLVVFNRTCVENLEKDKRQREIVGNSHSSSRLASDPEVGEGQDEGEIIIINGERRDSGVGSSLTRGSSHQQAPWHCFPNRPSPTLTQCPSKGPKSIPVTSLTAPQVLVLRKLSLLKLTTLMEKFSPSSRTGWSWAVPKFIRRIRTPDYKDKVVFGVPLLLILQRTGQPLPISIQAAIHYLRKTALDSTGLFRKSGVRSRIQKLRNLNESNPDKICYEDQQAYDVADMLKQYFRELPEALLTNKLSETFISIYQYIPEELRLEAIQAAILLMPDENREVLQSLLSFLQEVCQHAGENQMTATNLAVCFAPSLFHLSTPRSASASPRRRKTVGVPDIRELNENKAAYECLSSMVLNYKQLFSLSEEMVSQCHLSCMGDYEPATLEELSTIINRGHCGWKAYIDSCIQVLLKDAKDKYKGWVTVGQSDNVDLAYRKVGDGHPLRLWKVVTEVEAPPVELLNRILRERHVWDSSFLKWRVVNRLDKQTEVFQYISSSLSSHPTCDYCILRSWKTDLPKGACVLVEASVEHTDAPLMVDGVRAIVLASRYLIEPCGSGKSRITHISRVDTRGRSPEWYNRAYGHICTLHLTRLRDSFHHSIQTEGPETKV